MSKLLEKVYNWAWKATICVDVDLYNIYLKNNLIKKNLISYLKNIIAYPVYYCSHYTNIVSNSLLLLDGKVKSLKKRAVMRFYLDLANNAYKADANFHYTECGIAKLLQE